MTARVFIDGQAGATGVEIAARLSGRDDIELLTIAEADRKRPEVRARLMRRADVSILCLPDEAAREAAALAGDACRLLDASTAHRTAPGWVYGLPELSARQPEAIASARKVSNPGCYPQGFILCVRPLVEAGALHPSTPLALHALSGYSGGGRRMIDLYRSAGEERLESWGTRCYALHLAHKHLPEMQCYAAIDEPPLFSPFVGTYLRGMLTQVPLFSRQLAGAMGAREVREILAQAYADARFVDVFSGADGDALEDGYLSPTACNGSNRMEIMVFGNQGRLLLTARYDNLGKGAAGSAVQNLNLMLGRDPSAGLA